MAGVSLLDQGEKRTQILDWCFSPRYEYLPMIYSQYQGSSSVEAQGNVYKEKWEGPIWIQVENRIEENQIQSASLIYLLDQKEIKRTNIGLDKKSQQAYIEKAGNSYEENVVETQSAEEQENAMQDYYYYLENTISIPFGSEIAVYVEMVDTAGLKYRSLCTVQKFDKKGNPIESRLEGYIGAEPDIYDLNGNLVYSANEENLYEER